MLRSLNIKITLAIATTLIVVMSCSAFFVLSEQNRQAVDNTKVKAQLLTNTVTNIIRMEMESDVEPDLERLIRVAGEFRDIETLRIFNADGEIRYSADDEEIGKEIDEIVLNVFQSGDMSKPFRSEEKGHLSFCRVEVMYNETECNRCHGTDDEIIGILEVCLSMATTDAQIRSNARIMGLTTLGTILLVAFAISLLTTFMVKRPVSALMETMRKTREGDLDARVEARTNDELGHLGRSFNEMIERLDHAKHEVERLYEEQMRRSERLASIGEMAASVAHEIKNPLAGLSGAAQVLSKSFDEGDNRQQVTQEMLKLTDRLDKTIKDLLSFARTAAPAWQTVDLNQVIRETLFFVCKDADGGDCDIQEHLTDEIAPLPLDPQLMQQVMLNLIINARHACGKQGHVIVASSAIPTRPLPGDSAPEDFVEIRVSDDGPGISPEVQAEIFKPFYTTKTQGTGLGLPITRNIIDAHGGLIDIDTAPRRGTTFYVWLRKKRQER